MTGDRALYVVVLLVALTAVVSGPLVGVVDLTAAATDERAALDAGSASLDAVSVPDDGRIARGAFGAEAMYLDVAPARVDVASVEGRVQLSYQVSIRTIGYTGGTTLVLGPRDVGTHELALSRHAFPPGQIQADRYDATVRVTVYEASGPRTLAERSIVLRVER